MVWQTAYKEWVLGGIGRGFVSIGKGRRHRALRGLFSVHCRKVWAYFVVWYKHVIPTRLECLSREIMMKL